VLFDLKGKRRHVVQVTYLLLALLMGGGLVLFGIGSDAGQGGLVDAFTGGQGSEGSPDSAVSDRIEQAENRLRTNPRDAAALATLVRGNYQLATAKTGAESTTFPPEARPDLQKASDAWQRYLALDPERPDDSLAGLMLQVYGPSGLGRADEAARAAEIVAEARPSAAAYLNLAQYATLAGQQRKADLAEKRALDLASSAQERKAIKAQLAALERAAVAPGGGAGATPGGAGAPAGR
jgi:hypothetical protein